MKRLKHAVTWLIWSLIAFVVLFQVIMNAPAAQAWIAGKIAHAVSQKLNTEVHIGSVNIGGINRVIVDEVLIKDQSMNDMLKVGRLSVRMELLPLLDGRIVVSSAQLFNAHASLHRQDSLSQTNFQFVIDSLSSRDTTNNSALDLAINSLIVRNTSISYHQADVAKTPGRFNPAHLELSEISSHVILRHLTSNSLSVQLKRLAFKEQSGMTVNRMGFEIDWEQNKLNIPHLFLQLPKSDLVIDDVTATVCPAQLKDSLRFEGTLTETNITPSDLTFLLPELTDLKSVIKIKGRINGSAKHLGIERFSIQSSDGSISTDLAGWIHDTKKHPAWNLRLNRLAVSHGLLGFLGKLRDDFPLILSRLGDIEVKGEANGESNGHMDLVAAFNSELGQADLSGTYTIGQTFSGHIKTDAFELGSLLDNELLGGLSADVDVTGNSKTVHVAGSVSRLHFKGYDYQDILVDGNYDVNEGIAGRLSIDDPHLQAHIEGEIHPEKNSRINLTGNIARFYPKALGLSDNWGNASFSTNIEADISATTLSEATGSIDIEDFVMHNDTMNYRIDHLHVKSEKNGDFRFLKVSGDMGEAELHGKFEWATLPHSLYRCISSRLPSIPNLPTHHQPTDNDFEVDVHLTDTEWMKQLLGIDVTLQRPTVFRAMMNDRTGQAFIHGYLPQFSYKDHFFRDGRIDLTTPGDSILCQVHCTRYDGSRQNMIFDVYAQAAQDDLFTKLTWDNSRRDEACNHGELRTITNVYSNGSGSSEAHVRVLPSTIMMGSSEWEIEPGDIFYNKEQLLVDHFGVTHDAQHIIVEGIASDRLRDTLSIDLNQVEVAYVLDLVNFTAVSFAGKATGKAYVTHALSAPDAWADLIVEQFKFEGGKMGTLNAQAHWNKDDQQIDINAIARDGADANTYISGYVSPTHERIDLLIQGRGTHIDFLHSFTNSFLNNVSGHAYGDVRLIGPLGEMDLLGTLVVDAQATVTTLGTTYQLHGDTVRFVHDDILIDGATIHDKHGNSGTLRGGIHHKNLTQLTFDLDVATDRLLAYDMSPDDPAADPLFHGTVFAATSVDLHGRPGEIQINCNATPLEGTVFTYNAANPDAINDQRFINWHDHSLRLAADSQSSSSDVAQTTREDNPSDLRINFIINTQPEATIKLLMDTKTGDYITLGGNGVIQATYYNKGAFQMFGTYTVSRGTYGITIQNIIKKNFTFQPGGTIVFGGPPLDAALNLQALYTVNGVSLSDLNIGSSFTGNTVRVNCLMNILGQASAPRVEFDLDMPTVNSEEKQMIRSVIANEQEMNQQVLYLLGIGRFYTQGINNAETQQQYDQTQLAMQSFLSGTLSTQINEVLSQVLKSANWNFGANISTGNEGWHNAEYEGLVSGRMLNNRLLINGQFGYRDNATQASPSFIGDFDIRYLLHPNGNLALKVYNQTNDRYFTHSSLNTQGLGLIMKKDFNNLHDLFSHRRKRTGQETMVTTTIPNK